MDFHTFFLFCHFDSTQLQYFVDFSEIIKLQAEIPKRVMNLLILQDIFLIIFYL